MKCVEIANFFLIKSVLFFNLFIVSLKLSLQNMIENNV